MGRKAIVKRLVSVSPSNISGTKVLSVIEKENRTEAVPTSIESKSKQLEVARIEKLFRYTKDSLVKPELSLTNLVKLYKKNYAHFFCVNIKASCVSGVGYKFVAKDFNEQEVLGEITELKRRKKKFGTESKPVKVEPAISETPESDKDTPLTPDDEKRLAELEKQHAKHIADHKILEDFFSNINPDESFTSINTKTDVDRESVGFSCWEITRNGAGKIDGIYHMPSITVRMMNNNIGVCQIQNAGVGAFGNYNIERGSSTTEHRVFFKRIGLPVIMDYRTGKVVGLIEDPGPSQKITWINSSGEEDDSVAIDKKYWANEVIIQRKYDPEYFWYGMPDIVAALDACAGDKAAAEFQEQFFDNNAVPRMAVILTGASFDDDTEQDIKTFFEQDIRGNAHTTLVLEIPGEEKDDNGQTIPGSEIKFEKLATEVTDASFRQYRKDNCDQIVTVHRVPGSLLPIQGVNFNRDTGMVDLEVFKSQVIRPIQSDREFIINRYFIEQSMDIHTWVFQFNEIDSLDEFRKMQINKGYKDSNIMTINEIRRELGMPAKKGGDVLYSITPLGFVKIEDIDDLTTGELSAKPDKPLSGADQGGSDGGRPSTDDGDGDKASKSAVKDLAAMLKG